MERDPIPDDGAGERLVGNSREAFVCVRIVRAQRLDRAGPGKSAQPFHLLRAEGASPVVQKDVVAGRKVANYQIPEKEFPTDPVKPRVKLFGTGGTIASRLDYRTGAVIPAFTPGELYGAVPELADICNLDTEKVFAVFSENMGPDQHPPAIKRRS